MFCFLVVDKRSVNAAVKARDLHANETASLSPSDGESVGAAFKAATSTAISVMWRGDHSYPEVDTCRKLKEFF